MAKRAMTVEAKALKAQMILDKAAEMLMSSDYDKIKMSDIAKEMNLSNGILFVYFKTKEALFFNLLCREYEKRIWRLEEMIQEIQVTDFEDFKDLVMKELMELVDNNPLYVRLEAMRSAILEKNIDAEIMLKLKTKLHNKMVKMTSLICKNGALTQAEVMDIFQTEAAIIIGCKLSSSLPLEVIELIEKNGLYGFKRDFKKDVVQTMRYYLEGYSRK